MSVRTETQLFTEPIHASIAHLAQHLVQIPSRSGVDDYTPIVHRLTQWLTRHALHPAILKQDGKPVAVACDINGSTPGPHYVLDACLDTAGTGDTSKWTQSPFCGDIDGEGWLHGRGSSDSKAAVSVFSHLAAVLARDPDAFAGRLTLLFDLDEHTGGFAGIKTYLEQGDHIDGVMIGYPGTGKIVTGGRGFWRGTITIHGRSAHVGSHSWPGINAITRAALLTAMIDETVYADTDHEFGLPPKVTVTGIRGGQPGNFSVVPDRCELEIDARLTPAFDAAAAETFLRGLAIELDALEPVPESTTIEQAGETWPAYRLPLEHPMVTALHTGATQAGLSPKPSVAGPSNIGCLLSAQGIPATAGFGVAYRGLHGADEAIDLSTIPAVYAAYRHAVLDLLLRPSVART